MSSWRGRRRNASHTRRCVPTMTLPTIDQCLIPIGSLGSGLARSGRERVKRSQSCQNGSRVAVRAGIESRERTHGPREDRETRANEANDAASRVETRRTKPFRRSSDSIDCRDRANRQDPLTRYHRRERRMVRGGTPNQLAAQIASMVDRVRSAGVRNTVGTAHGVRILCERMTPTEPGNHTLSW